jgi:hypothetical protein
VWLQVRVLPLEPFEIADFSSGFQSKAGQKGSIVGENLARVSPDNSAEAASIHVAAY